MIVRTRVQYYDLTITVTGGTGSTTLEPYGKIKTIAMKAPTGSNPTLSLDISDSDGYGVWAMAGIAFSGGKATVKVDEQTQKKDTIQISNADVNGIYSLRLCVESSL